MDLATGADTSADPIIDAPVDAPADDTPPADATPAEELFELVVDGKPEKLTKAEVLKRASHASAAAKRMQEATKQRGEAEQLLKLAKDNPMALIKHLQGETFDERDFLTKRMAELLEDQLMSPEEKSQRQQLSELETLRQEKRQREEAEKQAALEAQMKEESTRLDTEISQALTDNMIPRTPGAIRRMADYMLDAAEAGLDVPAAKIAAQVKKDMIAELTELLTVSDDEVFANLLGSDLLTKAQKLSLKKSVKQPAQVVPADKAGVKNPTDAAAVKKPAKTRDDIMRELGLGDNLF
jgi:hypothetical protein